MEHKDISEILKNSRRIYFIGIGGISMSALAMIMKSNGFEVRGYDRDRSRATGFLEDNGIKVFYEPREDNCAGSDLVVYTAAISETDPEMISAKDKGIPCFSRAELLGTIAKRYENSIAIAGTHGKSTTSGMLSQIFLSYADYDPTILIGAELPSINSTYRTGHDKNFIFEACEYKDSFLSFFPGIAVILNVEHDHPDYFKDMDQMVASFAKFLSNTGNDGKAVVNYDSPYARKAAKGYGGELYTFSLSGDKEADFTPGEITFNRGMASFGVYFRGKKIYDVKLSVPGKHNVSNALAACACAYLCGVPAEVVEKGLHDFKGVNRRFEYKGTFNGSSVYDDYAHHPDEIKATLGAAKQFGAKKITVVFQPHTFSRLKEFFDDFTKAFENADQVIFTDVYSARETNVYGVDSLLLSQNVPGSLYISEFDDIIKKLQETVGKDGIVIIMGAGSINALTPKLLNSQAK
ncbi:MAG: UDP-N-acetylmuramate--L-alanine ligase [Clostridia bacterium]|nr:UDP-N-acetylmuramate--L-alanine ligase [Clostridia bacterium]